MWNTFSVNNFEKMWSKIYYYRWFFETPKRIILWEVVRYYVCVRYIYKYTYKHIYNYTYTCRHIYAYTSIYRYVI